MSPGYSGDGCGGGSGSDSQLITLGRTCDDNQFILAV